MRGACASRAIPSQRPDFAPRLSGTEARLTLAHAAVRRQVAATSATDFESLPCFSSRSWGSFAAEVLDEVIDEATGVDIFGESDRPVYTRLKTLLRAEIATGTPAGETWRIKAEKFPPAADRRHAPGLWGAGALTNGARTLEVTYRNAPPFDEAKCSEMIRARDDHRWACYERQITEISEDGEWLASYDSYARAYTFRAGLDGDLKLPILAALEAMRTNGTPDGF